MSLEKFIPLKNKKNDSLFCNYIIKIPLLGQGTLSYEEENVLKRHLQKCEKCQREQRKILQFSKEIKKFIPKIKIDLRTKNELEKEIKDLFDQSFSNELDESYVSNFLWLKPMKNVLFSLGKSALSLYMVKYYGLGIFVWYLLKKYLAVHN